MSPEAYTSTLAHGLVREYQSLKKPSERTAYVRNLRSERAATSDPRERHAFRRALETIESEAA